MGKDIEKASRSPSFKKLLSIFESSDQVVILTAEDSSHACKLFQQQILTTGKLIRIQKAESHQFSSAPAHPVQEIHHEVVHGFHSVTEFHIHDPFVEVKGLVEEGININQVELVGIIWESDVPMAILVDTKNPSISYTLKEDDKILNGKVLKITQTDVLFLIQEFGVSRRYTMGLPDKFGGQK